MNKTQTDTPPRDVARHARPGLLALADGAGEKAERRRLGLRVVLARHGLTPSTLARRLGMMPNRFHNFLNGQSDSLALDTIEAVLILLPTVTFEELVGWTETRPTVIQRDP